MKSTFSAEGPLLRIIFILHRSLVNLETNKTGTPMYYKLHERIIMYGKPCQPEQQTKNMIFWIIYERN